MIGILRRKSPLNDTFVVEKDNRIVKLDLPLTNYGLWYNKKDSIIEIISRNYITLIKYAIHLRKMEVMILDTIDVDGKGYYYILGGESNQIERGKNFIV